MSKQLIPFAPSLATARTILTCRVAACRDRDMCFPLGRGYRPAQGKDLARTVIAGERMLSVPVVGGAARLKRLPTKVTDSLRESEKSADLSEIMISDHGAWRREHLGAWNAAYGKAPFFPYIFPLLEETYANHSHATLAEFNEALWKIVPDFLNLEESLPALGEMRVNHPERLEAIRAELSTKVNINHSIFDAIFRLGKNVIFLL